MASYVEYSSNNSGGSWWLSDQNWKDLEAAGWKVAWTTLEHEYSAKDDYVREPDGTPKLVPIGQGNSKFPSLVSKDGRWLGALAKVSYKPNCDSIRDAAAEWERITGQNATDPGCACCGQPHRFTLYRDGKYIESGPDIDYVARWA